MLDFVLFVIGICSGTMLVIFLICWLCLIIDNAIQRSKQRIRDIETIKKEIKQLKHIIIGEDYDEEKCNRKRRD